MTPQAQGAFDPGAFVAALYQLRLRSREDRAHISRLYTAHFGGELAQGGLCYSMTPSWLHVGFVSLPRRPASERAATGVPLMLSGMLEPMQAIMMCVCMRWMCLLTGPAASGKTNLIRSAPPPHTQTNTPIFAVCEPMSALLFCESG